MVSMDYDDDVGESVLRGGYIFWPCFIALACCWWYHLRRRESEYGRFDIFFFLGLLAGWLHISKEGLSMGSVPCPPDTGIGQRLYL